MDTQMMEQEIVASSSQHGIDVVSADCPDELSGTAGTSFSCTAIDAAGAIHPVDISVDDSGYFNWTITE